MRCLFLCGREVDYTRNQVLLRALTRIGEVDQVVESGARKSIILRSIRISLRALPRLTSQKYDLVFVGFYGHFLMLPIGLLSRRPVLFDAFVSTYDTLTSDRQNFPPDSLRGRLAASLDRSACKLARHVLLDTHAQEEYFISVLRVPSEKLSSLPVSCNEDIFYPRNIAKSNNKTTILFYCTYLPLHGVETILRAAKMLHQETIHFRMIGDGPLYKSARNLASELGLENLTFLPPVSLVGLADEIAGADLCLGGHFGTSDKAGKVIPGKIYQMLAMAKPIVAADSPANKELLTHGESAYLCHPGNPDALASAIGDLHRDPELARKLGSGGRAIYEQYCSETVVTGTLRNLISDLLNLNPH